jgi:hypothetical protein
LGKLREAQLVDPEAAAELGEAAALAGVMAVRGVRSCRERLASGEARGE